MNRMKLADIRKAFDRIASTPVIGEYECHLYNLVSSYWAEWQDVELGGMWEVIQDRAELAACCIRNAGLGDCIK